VEKWTKQPEKITGGLWPEDSVEAVFKGKRNVQVVRGQKKGDQPSVTVRFRATANAQKVYFFACQTTDKSYESHNERYFDAFFSKGVKLAE